MLSVSLAVICDYGVGSSWLNSRSSFPEGLIIFNPLHTGGQLRPIQPNIQSIIIFKMVSMIFFMTSGFIQRLKPNRNATLDKKNPWGFENMTQGVFARPTSLSLLLLSDVCQRFSQSEHWAVRGHKLHQSVAHDG